MLKQWLVGALVALLVGTSFTIKAYLSEVEQHAVTTEKLNQSNEALARYVEALHQMGEDQAIISAEKQELVAQYLLSTRELKSMKNREATVLAKKSLVAKKINAAFKKQQEEYACITGDTKLCEY